MKTKLASALCAVFIAFAGLTMIPAETNAQIFEDGAEKCYCDETASGCFNDGDSALCSKKTNCVGGKCKPKTDPQIQ